MANKSLIEPVMLIDGEYHARRNGEWVRLTEPPRFGPPDDAEPDLAQLAAEMYEKGSSPSMSPSPVAESALTTLRAFLKITTQESRLAIWEALTHGYCTACGTDDPRCQCWNDE